MFTDVDCGVVGFYSNVNTERNTNENSSQTIEFSTKNVEISSYNSETVAAQTEYTSVSEMTTTLHPTTSSNLIKWLENIIPEVLKEMKRNESSVIFNGYDPYEDNKKEEIKANLLQNLNTKNANRETLVKNETQNMPITALSWSSAGTSLAVASGNLYHNDWCQHDGYLHVYSVRGREEELKPIQSVKISTCVTSVDFHPSEPALLATATFSGEIIIWNLQNLQSDANENMLSSNSEMHSGKSVSSLSWMNSEQIIKYFYKTIKKLSLKVLVSAGSDGIIIVWLIDTITLTLNVHIRFEIKATTIDKIKYSPDICCMDFIQVWEKTQNNNEVNEREFSDDYFVIGCRTGEVLLCKMYMVKFSATDSCIGNFQSHNASLLSLKFCPVRSHIFLTLGADCEIRIYSLMTNLPIQVLFLDYECSSVNWLPNSGTYILLAGTKRSTNKSTVLQVFNIVTKFKKTIEHADQGENMTEISAVSINDRFNNRLACGDVSGSIKIWNVPLKDMTEGE